MLNEMSYLIDEQVQGDSSMLIELMPHQHYALEAAKGKEYFAYLMGTGTGKTYVVLEEARRLMTTGMVEVLVVISPKALCLQWEHEIDTYYNSIKNFNYKVNYRRPVIRLIAGRLNIFIINIEAFSRGSNKYVAMVKLLMEHEHDKTMLVLDESHKIKSMTSKRTKQIIKAGLGVKYKRILSGSAVTENIENAYSQYRFLSNTIFPYNLQTFVHHFVVTKKAYSPYGSFITSTGSKNLDIFKEIVAPYTYSIAIEDCVDLPDKIYTTITTDLSPANRKAYDKLVDDFIYSLKDQEESDEILVPFALSRFHKFHEIISRDDSKYQAIDQIIDQHPSKNIVIWLSHLNELAMLRSILPLAYKNKIIGFVGGGDSRDLQRIQDLDILVMLMQTGSHGLNLQHFTINIYFNRMYSMEMKLQSEARTYRLGTRERVFYYDIVCIDTIDEMVQEVLNKKTIMVSDLLRMLRGNTQ